MQAAAAAAVVRQSNMMQCHDKVLDCRRQQQRQQQNISKLSINLPSYLRPHTNAQGRTTNQVYPSTSTQRTHPCLCGGHIRSISAITYYGSCRNGGSNTLQLQLAALTWYSLPLTVASSTAERSLSISFSADSACSCASFSVTSASRLLMVSF
jgi:hypothetical protein